MMLNVRLHWLAALLAAAAVTGDLPAADGPEAAPEALAMTVEEVTGSAQRLLPGQKPKWLALKAGDRLDELTVIRTGFRSRVVLAFADNSRVVIDRATKMGVGQFRKQGRVTRTRLGLKYGSVRAAVEKARGPNDFRVATPEAALAVTGTEGRVAYTGDLGFALEGITGTWAVTAGARRRNVKGAETVDSTMKRHIRTVHQSVAPKLGDVYGGLTESEQNSLLRHGGGRGAIGFAGAGLTANDTLRPANTADTSTTEVVVIKLH